MISVVIPCFNEEKNIGNVIRKVRKSLDSNFEIIVVDNNSRDKTAKIAKENKVKVVVEEKAGKGNAVRKGARIAKGEILVFIDGDNSYSAQFIPKIIKRLIKDKSDIVYGSRFLKESKTKISLLRLFGNKIFSFLGFFLYKKKLDFLTGLFAIKKDRFLKLNPKSNGFEIETEIFKKAIKKNFKIGQVPITYKANKESRINPILDGLRIFFTLLKKL